MSESDSQSLDMSSNTNLFPKSVSKNSHSFDDRICDDLSEVLLQFLSLEDKLRLECVSKQFQRTLFQKQFSISSYSYRSKLIEDKKKYKFLIISIPILSVITEKREIIEDKDYAKHYLKSIESLLKKCPNIQKMHLFIKSNENFKSILPLITKHCNHLEGLED